MRRVGLRAEEGNEKEVWVWEGRMADFGGMNGGEMWTAETCAGERGRDMRRRERYQGNEMQVRKRDNDNVARERQARRKRAVIAAPTGVEASRRRDKQTED